MTRDQDGTKQPEPGASPPPPPEPQQRPIEVAGKPWKPRLVGEEVKGSQGGRDKRVIFRSE